MVAAGARSGVRVAAELERQRRQTGNLALADAEAGDEDVEQAAGLEEVFVGEEVDRPADG